MLPGPSPRCRRADENTRGAASLRPRRARHAAAVPGAGGDAGGVAVRLADPSLVAACTGRTAAHRPATRRTLAGVGGAGDRGGYAGRLCTALVAATDPCSGAARTPP